MESLVGILILLGWLGWLSAIVHAKHHHNHPAFVCSTIIRRRGGSVDTAAATTEDSILADQSIHNASQALDSTTDNKSNMTESYNESGLEIDILVNNSQQDDADVDDNNNNNDAKSASKEITKEDAAREQAVALRAQGKELHDQGEFQKAADIFLQASRLLLEYTMPNDPSNHYLEVAEEYATCRLHEALCRLKEEDYEQCIEACSDVLNDPTPPQQHQPQPESDGEGESATSHTTTTNRTRLVAPISGAARARAFHRRAKAKLGLEDTEGALEDARSAAFLGDRKAVALYGRLLRSHDPSSLGGGGMMDAAPYWLSQGNSNGGGNDGGFGSSMTSSLFESLLGKSSPSNNGNDPMSGMLSDLLSNNLMNSMTNGNKNGNSAGGLAQSVLKSLSKRLDDASTQDLICNYLQSTNANQLQQLASLAGFQVSQQQATQVVNFCHKVTPKGIARTVSNTRRVVYGVTLIRKSLKVIRKYNSVLIIVAILAWAKSAVLRPIPINKKLAKQVLNAALKQSRKL